jgi:4-hydroxybenzoate polyprenyltransferase
VWSTGATLRLVRADTSLAGFLLLFLPVLSRTADVRASLLFAAPLLFISMCTFIANDLNDHERDEINHPERPLPSGHISPPFAAALYFVCLASALFTTRYFVQESVAFWYYFLIALSISYGHVVEFLPTLKAPYVAAVIAMPVLIVASSFRSRRLYGLALATFLFNVGKELCMDVLDRPGDTPSLLHRVSPRRIALAAISIQLVSYAVLLALSASDTRNLTRVFLLATAGLQALSVHYVMVRDMRKAVRAMRVALLISFYFIAIPSR